MTALDEAREALVLNGLILRRAGLSPGRTGNLSLRHGERILATATATDLGSLVASDLSLLSETGELLDGRQPTKETFMHLAMYRAADDIGAVVHLHPTHATAVSCLRDLDENNAIPPLTPYLTMKGGRVRIVPYFAPGDAAVAVPVFESVSAGFRVILLANHGCLVGARDLGDAVAIAQELEEAARIMLVTMGLPVRPLDEGQLAVVDKLRAAR